MKNNTGQKNKDNENRVNDLINVVEKKVRTERHLEQYSDRKDDESLEPAKRLQDIREEEINNIKNNIINEGHNNENEYDNLKQNYTYSENYMENNKNHMSTEDLQNLKNKQENRKEQMDNLDTF